MLMSNINESIKYKIFNNADIEIPCEYNFKIIHWRIAILF